MTAEFAIADIPEEDHGTTRGYQYQKCRCVECRAWNAQRSRIARQKGRVRQPNGKGQVSLYVAYEETAPPSFQPRSDPAPWRDLAECRGKPPEWWFPTKKRHALFVAPYAASLCRECPVRVECGEHADRFQELGIWGGVFRYERTKKHDFNATIAEAVGASQPVSR